MLVLDADCTLEMIRDRKLDEAVFIGDIIFYFDHMWSVLQREYTKLSGEMI